MKALQLLNRGEMKNINAGYMQTECNCLYCFYSEHQSSSAPIVVTLTGTECIGNPSTLCDEARPGGYGGHFASGSWGIC